MLAGLAEDGAAKSWVSLKEIKPVVYVVLAREMPKVEEVDENPSKSSLAVLSDVVVRPGLYEVYTSCVSACSCYAARRWRCGPGSRSIRAKLEQPLGYSGKALEVENLYLGNG